MKDKINVAELLIGCPSGMELDCTMFEGVYFDHVDDLRLNRIKCYVDNGDEHFEIAFEEYGQYISNNSAKCVIFPKGKTTWEGFVPPCKFKDGDIVTCKDGGLLVACIYKERKNTESFNHHIALYKGRLGILVNGEIALTDDKLSFATEEEKAKLFQAIKDKGYKWNEETKTLEKLVESKFKSGDILYCNANDDGEDEDMFKYIFIFDKIVDGRLYYSHCHLFGNEFYDTEVNLVHDYSVRFATDEEKQKLFQAIKDNGYKWNAETKTLEKLPKFKCGDVVACDCSDGNSQLFIFKEYNDGDTVCYLFLDTDGTLDTDEFAWEIDRLATEREKELLFRAIEEKGYRWNEETKTLEKLIEPLIEPKFKIGDKVRHKDDKTIIKTISYIYYDSYALCDNHLLLFADQDMWALVPNKFDINTLVPFESRVLIRDTKSQKWYPAIWGFYDSDGQDYQYKLVGVIARYCIPYECNEHLLGKTDDCNEYFKTWK